MLARPPDHVRRIAFLGTPAMAVPPLRALHAAGIDIAVVVTRPDTRRGRGGATSPSPVKAAAAALGLPVAHEVDAVVDAEVDLGVVVAYGQLIREPVLERVPMVNLHFSLLPRWRGAAPVERALLAGDEVTGVCVMAVDVTLDTGDVYRREEVPVGRRDDAETVRAHLVEAGSRLLVTALTEGLGAPRPQQGTPTYAAKLGPEDLHIDWTGPTELADRQVRVGGAWTTFRRRRLKIWRAEPVAGADPGTGEPGAVDGTEVVTGDGRLRLVEVQPEGRARQGAQDWANGARVQPHERLGS